jgi:alkaline phosphatase D
MQKRLAYNAVRAERSYATIGPLRAGEEIPVLATWDDHDYAYDNAGNEYACPLESQNEFVVHFSVPPEDPRHPAHPAGQQRGVYNSRMFTKPGTQVRFFTTHIF